MQPCLLFRSGSGSPEHLRKSTGATNTPSFGQRRQVSEWQCMSTPCTHLTHASRPFALLITPHRVMLRLIASWCAMSCPVPSRRVPSCPVTSRPVTSRHVLVPVASRRVASRRVASRHVTMRYFVLRYLQHLYQYQCQYQYQHLFQFQYQHQYPALVPVPVPMPGALQFSKYADVSPIYRMLTNPCAKERVVHVTPADTVRSNGRERRYTTPPE